MCEGFSLDDVLALDAAQIAEYGFVIIGVDGSPPDDGSPWAYTIGLLDAADHPELIIAGPSLETSGSMLSLLAHSVLDDGDRYELGDTIDLGASLDRGGGDAVVGAVHEIHYVLDTFNMWHNLQEYGAAANRRARSRPDRVVAPVLLSRAPLLATGARVRATSRRAARREPRRAPAPAAATTRLSGYPALTATTSTYSLGIRSDPAFVVLCASRERNQVVRRARSGRRGRARRTPCGSGRTSSRNVSSQCSAERYRNTNSRSRTAMLSTRCRTARRCGRVFPTRAATAIPAGGGTYRRRS